MSDFYFIAAHRLKSSNKFFLSIESTIRRLFGNWSLLIFFWSRENGISSANSHSACAGIYSTTSWSRDLGSGAVCCAREQQTCHIWSRAVDQLIIHVWDSMSIEIFMSRIFFFFIATQQPKVELETFLLVFYNQLNSCFELFSLAAIVKYKIQTREDFSWPLIHFAHGDDWICHH